MNDTVWKRMTLYVKEWHSRLNDDMVALRMTLYTMELYVLCQNNDIFMEQCVIYIQTWTYDSMFTGIMLQLILDQSHDSHLASLFLQGLQL